MATISWGKCSILFAKHDDSATGYQYSLENIKKKFILADTPANRTTNINITDGEKHEAEVEGGGVEAVLFDDDKFELQFDIRRAAGRKLIAVDVNGTIGGTWAFAVQPQDPNAPAILVEAAALNRTPNYASTDGLIDHYVASCLKPATGNTVKIGTVSADTTGSGNAKSQTEIASPKAANGVAGSEYYVQFHEQTEVYTNGAS